MLKMSWECDNCGDLGEFTDFENMIGCCPRCMSHHGEIHYYCDMSVEDFLKELTNMSDKDMVKYADAIRECAFDLIEKGI